MLSQNTYLEYIIRADKDHFEIIIAFMSTLGFDSFQERDKDIIAWIDEQHVGDQFNAELVDSIPVPFTYEVHKVEQKNWNEVWESQFDPVLIHSFCCIKADFHTIEHDCKYEILINPKMAFGTGHHETTELMITTMESIDFHNRSVLDFGTGTGILAILASKMEAAYIHAIDHDPNSIDNTHENIQINNADHIEVSGQDVDTIVNRTYDIILANVNRSAIMSSLAALHRLLIPQGILLISGVLQEDKELVLSSLEDHHLDLIRINKKGEWLCIQAAKSQC